MPRISSQNSARRPLRLSLGGEGQEKWPLPRTMKRHIASMPCGTMSEAPRRALKAMMSPALSAEKLCETGGITRKVWLVVAASRVWQGMISGVLKAHQGALHRQEY